MRALSVLAKILVFLAVLLVPARALADKVALLPFTAVGQAGSSELEGARTATKAAITAKGHTLVPDPEVTAAQVAGDGVPDTSQEYRTVGTKTGAQWTVAGRFDPREGGYRIEIEACQIQTGRVESLARDIDPPDATNQIGEMLALLLRPEGIGNADIPWQHGQPKPKPKPVEPPPPPPPPAQPPPPPPPPPPPAVKHAYAENHPIALGAGVAVTSAVSRPANASGSPNALNVQASGGYALAAVPGLELRADFSGTAVGPGAIIVDGGARYAFGIVPTARLFAGPEVTLGALFPTGGDRSARFYARGSAVVALGLGEHAQIELSGDVAPALGDATLLFVGGTLRGLVRF